MSIAPVHSNMQLRFYENDIIPVLSLFGK